MSEKSKSRSWNEYVDIRYVPALLAVCHVVDHLDVDKDAVGKRRAQGHHPDGANRDPAGGHFHARPERVQDDEEAIDGDGCQRQRRYVHRRPLLGPKLQI